MSPTARDRRRKQVRDDSTSDPSATVRPTADEAAAAVAVPPADVAPIAGHQLDAAILRFLRRFPNQTVDLTPLAEQFAVDPFRVQLAVEDLARRRMVVAPFVEPATAGGATLTQIGLRWLIAREGGTPADTPVAFQPAKERVRAEDEAARLPRAQVYGVKQAE